MDQHRLGEKVGNYTLHHQIGQGNTSQVWCAMHLKMRTCVAIKIIDISKTDNKIKQIEREIEMLQKLDHPYVAHLFEVFKDTTSMYLVMELLPNGSILDLVNAGNGIPEAKARRMFTQVIIAIDYFHRKGIIHRDIKASNIMLDVNQNVRIMDFGLSNKIDVANTFCGSPIYAAPELIMRESYDEKIDNWSAGVLLFFMIFGHFPFNDNNINRLLQMIVSHDVEYPDHISTDLKHLLSKLLQRNPEQRYSTEEILRDPWIIAGESLPPLVQPYDFHQIKHFIKTVKNIECTPEELLNKVDKNIQDDDTVMYKIALNEKRISDTLSKPKLLSPMPSGALPCSIKVYAKAIVAHRRKSTSNSVPLRSGIKRRILAINKVS